MKGVTGRTRTVEISKALQTKFRHPCNPPQSKPLTLDCSVCGCRRPWVHHTCETETQSFQQPLPTTLCTKLPYGKRELNHYIIPIYEFFYSLLIPSKLMYRVDVCKGRYFQISTVPVTCSSQTWNYRGPNDCLDHSPSFPV